ncbi:MAG: cation:proton antiporter [Alphaproteobacteria bacterium]|nr:cation:proton antiporter [Alphaproteobacteria bacterium]
MAVFAQLLLLLVLTRACGEGAVRIGQSAAIGELGAGVVLAALAAILGPSVPFFPELIRSEAFHTAAEVGIFSLMLLAGIELKPSEIAEHSMGRFLVALGGVIVPLGCGVALGLVFLPPGEARSLQALLIGIAMAITAIPASVRILSDLGLLRAPVGRVIIGAALFDDVIGLLLLAILTGLGTAGEIPGAGALALMLAKMVLFFAITVGIGVHIYPRVSRGLRTLQATAMEFSVLTAVALAYGLLAELLGMHWIMGAFMAGLFFEPERVGFRAYAGSKLIIGGVTAGVFAPLFFASIGARIDFSSIAGAPVFLISLIVLAFLGKLIGAGLPARLIGLSARDATAVGVGMSSRGAVELVVLSVAVQAGIISDSPGPGAGGAAPIFSSLVVMAVVTTLVAPIMLRGILRGSAPKVPPGTPLTGGPADPSDRS